MLLAEVPGQRGGDRVPVQRSGALRLKAPEGACPREVEDERQCGITLEVVQPQTVEGRQLTVVFGDRPRPGFVSLTHPTAGGNIIFLETGLSTFRPAENAGPAGQGLLLVFVVDDLDDQYARIVASGARVVTEPETEPWGERYCQFADPNGIIWQLVQWVD